MRAGQDRDHVAPLCRLLLARARTAALANRASLFMRSIIVHRVRIDWMHGLLRRLVYKLVMPRYFALASTFTNLMVTIIVAAAADLGEALARHAPGSRPAAHFLFLEL